MRLERLSTQLLAIQWPTPKAVGSFFFVFPKDCHAFLMLSFFNFPSFQMSVKLPRYGDCKFYAPP